jgi:hypothetical protein
MNASFRYNKQDLEIKFSEKLDFISSNFLADVLKNIEGMVVVNLLFDLSETKFITLPAVNFILCFTSFLRKTNNRNLTTKIKIESKNVVSFLTDLRFFSQMNTYGNLLIPTPILDNEKSISERRYLDKNRTSMIFPLTTILDNQTKSDFEDYGRNFAISFGNFFNELTLNPDFNFINNKEESQKLFGALYENVKNVNDHSNSEGFGSIQASPYLKGTIISFFDSGIGIIKSVLNSKRYELNVDGPKVVVWALEKGNSSKGGDLNHGTGFTIIKKFVDDKNGTLAIRTDKYIFVYKTGLLKLYNTQKEFPGTQIAIFTPLKKMS